MFPAYADAYIQEQANLAAQEDADFAGWLEEQIVALPQEPTARGAALRRYLRAVEGLAALPWASCAQRRYNEELARVRAGPMAAD